MSNTTPTFAVILDTLIEARGLIAIRERCL